ncbi:RsiG family protein [Yinghuangia soli]|uniref:ABC transporter substrate-binding protein n=1 Tax=Yinghuangia soli TaxID=2908204 RepID=A0AA41PW78_9ACTN|nr:ABC transporter substrate-binding protein [Yinghuangia soli]MCF2526878.1 ABC transporter substrate-binding protein [Yinghuangia soli]
MADPLKPPAPDSEGPQSPDAARDPSAAVPDEGQAADSAAAPDSATPAAGPGPAAPGPAPDALADADPVRALALDQVRGRRREAQREESDLSFLRRLLQGRIDILRAELSRREDPSAAGDGPGGGPAPVMEQLSEILSERRAPARGARHVTVHPPRTERYRPRIERMLADVELSDLAALSDTELRAALENLTGHEQEVSARRLELQREADHCGAEIARRYREGEARVDDLLSGR